MLRKPLFFTEKAGLLIIYPTRVFRLVLFIEGLFGEDMCLSITGSSYTYSMLVSASDIGSSMSRKLSILSNIVFLGAYWPDFFLFLFPTVVNSEGSAAGTASFLSVISLRSGIHVL